MLDADGKRRRNSEEKFSFKKEVYELQITNLDSFLSIVQLIRKGKKVNLHFRTIIIFTNLQNLKVPKICQALGVCQTLFR